MNQKFVWAIAAASLLAISGCGPEPGATDNGKGNGNENENGNSDDTVESQSLLCDNVMTCEDMVERGYMTPHQNQTKTKLFPCLYQTPDGSSYCLTEYQFPGEWVRDPFTGSRMFWPGGRCLGVLLCQ